MMPGQLKNDTYTHEDTILPRNSQLFQRVIEKHEEVHKFSTFIKNDSNTPPEFMEVQKEMNKLFSDMKQSAEKERRDKNRMLFAATLIGAGETAVIFAAGNFLTWRSSGVNYYLYLQLGLAVLLLIVGIVTMLSRDKNMENI